MTDKLEQNKQTVTAFYDLMFNRCQPAEAIEKYVGDVYIQHNPAVPTEAGFHRIFREDGERISGQVRPV